MRLFFYYVFHTAKNSLKKLFKTWVLVFLVICLAGGPEKAESILAAARLHYFDTLVTDSNTALAFYEMCRD